ncbi:MAG: radical SAM protein [bacterium]|nr:radical SAM protein [bacterium]
MVCAELQPLDAFTAKLIICRSFVLETDSKFAEKLLEQLKTGDKQTVYTVLRKFSGKLKHAYTERPVWFVENLPLIGYNAFGIIDRGTNILQVRPITGCNLSCIFCSVDEGKLSRTRINDFVVKLEDLVAWYREVASVKRSKVEAHIDGQGEPLIYPWFRDLVQALAEEEKTRIVSFQTNGTLLTEELIYELADMPKPVRVNLSLNTLDPVLAARIHGAPVDLQKILELLELMIELKKQGKLDVLLAPLYLPGINDEDIPRIIERYAVGKGLLVLVQKFEKYKLGRVPKLREYQDWREFFAWLKQLEQKYKVPLVIDWQQMFGTQRDVRYPIRLDRKIIEIVFPGRTSQEYIGVVDRKYLIMVYSTRKLEQGDVLRARKINFNDSILYTYV